jgi:hypothetical protein
LEQGVTPPEAPKEAPKELFGGGGGIENGFDM